MDAFLSLRRPPAPPSLGGDLTFQLVDVQELNVPSGQRVEAGVRALGKTLYILFGMTIEGYSVSVTVSDFQHYIYVGADVEQDLSTIQGKLNDYFGFASSDTSSLKMERMPADYRSIYVFAVQKRYIYKLSFSDKTFYGPIRTFFLDPGIWRERYSLPQFKLFEADLDSSVRFLVDLRLCGFGWITLKAGTYSFCSHEKGRQTLRTTQQIQVQASRNALVSHDFNLPEYSRNAPIRIMSFDLECVSLQGGFPDVANDFIINISASLYILTQSTADAPYRKVTLTLGTCAPIIDADVISFETEAELLLAFAYLVLAYDPDVFTGYNIDGFDWGYILKRAEVLNLKVPSLEIQQLGPDDLWRLIRQKQTPGNGYPYSTAFPRILGQNAIVSKSHFQSKQIGHRDTFEFSCSGRISFDLLPAIKQSYFLRSYTLNAVCARFLDEQKDDVHYSTITPLFRSDAMGRRRIAVYCIKDSVLPLKLLEKLMLFINCIEMCRVTGLIATILITSGQQIRILSLLYRACAQDRVLVPYRDRRGTTTNFDGDELDLEGATVLEPRRGFYPDTVPIATLDFNSLYPSIIIAHNLCYTTILVQGDIDKEYLAQHYLRSQKEGTQSLDLSAAKTVIEELLGLTAVRKAPSTQVPETRPVQEDSDPIPDSESSSNSDSDEGSSPMSHPQLKRRLDASGLEAGGVLGSAKNDLMTVTPLNCRFVRPAVRQGILPRILSVLLTARKKVKQELKRETDPLRKSVLDARQLALKTTANSIYGFTGSIQYGRLPSREISSSITAFGREMIEYTRSSVEERFKTQKEPLVIRLDDPLYAGDAFIADYQRDPAAYPHISMTPDGSLSYAMQADSTVIYGDTDSVMVRFGVNTIKEAMFLAKFAATYVSEMFLKPINLEFEKVYCPYLLINKKRYAGLYWSNSTAPDKLDSKGLELVRRDNCRLVGLVMEQTLSYLFHHSNPKLAMKYIRSVVHDLANQRIDLSLLVISKAITQPLDQYTNKQQAHLALAQRLRERDPASAPKVGDRVPYVIIAGDKNTKLYERSESPTYVIEQGLQVDTDYYLHQQLMLPVSRLFRSILKCATEKDAANAIFRTELNISRVVSLAASASLASTATSGSTGKTPKKAAGILGMVRATRVATCCVCNVRLSAQEPFLSLELCQTCLLERGREYYGQLQRELLLAEYRYHQVCAECIFCSGELSSIGDLEDGILRCSSADCSLFYARMKCIADRRHLTRRFNALSKLRWLPTQG